MRCIHQVECVSPRMMWLSGCFSGQNIVFISLYAPTNVYSSSDKCAFYDFVNEHLKMIPDKYQQIICGDMNARIGPLVGGTWGDVRGKYHCYGSIQNENGLLMLEFCQRNRLRICNSLFHQKNYGTWKHPRSKQYHTLDYCLVANRLSPLVQKCMIVREMDCWSDHIAVMTTLRLHRKKRFIVDCTVSDKSVAKIDYSVLSSNKRLRKELGSLIDQGIGNIEKGSSKDYRILNDIINKACEEILPKIGKKCKHQDWFDVSRGDVIELVSQRRKAWLKDRSKSHEYLRIKAKIQRECRAMQNKYWLSVSDHTQQLWDSNNSRGYSEALKVIYGYKKMSTDQCLQRLDGTLAKTPAEIQD